MRQTGENIYTSFVLFSLFACALTEIAVSPCGIKMCKLKCDETIDCQALSFLQHDLSCCVGYDGSNCFNGSARAWQTFKANRMISKTSENNSYCQHGARFFNTNNNISICRDKRVREVGGTAELSPQKCLSLGFHKNNGVINRKDSADFIQAIKIADLLKVKCMLSLKLVDINMKWKGGVTSVFRAAFRGHKAVFEHLVSQVCDLTVRNDKNFTPLHAACSHGSVAIVKTLLEELRVNKEDFGMGEMTPLLKAALSGKREILKYLVDQGCDVSASDSMERNSLHLVCNCGHKHMISLLIPLLDRECRPRDKSTPVLIAAQFDQADVLKLLVRQGCDLKLVDVMNDGVLHVAAKHASVHVAEVLMDDYNVSIEGKGRYEMTPFLTAVFYNRPRVMALLVARSCNLSVVDSRGGTALHIAVHRKIVTMLKPLLDKYKLNINTRNRQGKTPLMMAIRYGHVKSFDVLLDRGANTSDKHGHVHTLVQMAKKQKSTAKRLHFLRRLNVTV